MKSLVFPIAGSLVIGGGAITAPIYATFIEKAIEDSKEPTPIVPSYDYKYELDVFHKDKYGREFSCFYSSESIPTTLERDKTYLFHTNLGIIDEETHDWFFGFGTWYFQMDFSYDKIDPSKIDVDVWIDGIKQNKQEDQTLEQGTDDYVVSISQDINFYGYHSYTPPNYKSVFDVCITPHYSLVDLDYVRFRNR